MAEKADNPAFNPLRGERRRTEFDVVTGDGLVRVAIRSGSQPVRRTHYPWGQMRPGDELVTDNKAVYEKMKNAATAWAKRKGWRITCRWSRQRHEGVIFRES
jgi:hypothetical protein